MVNFFWHLAPDFSFSIKLHHFCPALRCPVAQLSYVVALLLCCFAVLLIIFLFMRCSADLFL